MIKAMSDAGLSSLPCVAHTFRFDVYKRVWIKSSVADAVAVGYSKHCAFYCLEDIQAQLQQPMKRLQQDMQTVEYKQRTTASKQ